MAYSGTMTAPQSSTRFMVTNNQKSLYRWHIKEHLVYASVNPIEYFVISSCVTRSSTLFLYRKRRIFWLDKLLRSHNPIKGWSVVFAASDILFGCCIRWTYTTGLSLMNNKSILNSESDHYFDYPWTMSISDSHCSNLMHFSFHHSIN